MLIDFKKRLLTSVALFFLMYICIYANLKIILGGLIIIASIACIEFINITNKIYRTKNENLANLFLVLSIFYFFILVVISYYLISFDRLYFLYILLICSFSDIGGYLSGNIFKGRKLTKISPNKTISGSYGSFVFSLIPFFFLKIIFLNYQFENINFVNNAIYNILICLYLSLSCQLGDIFISYFKRLAKIKDTGKMLPGHGGLLDRIDGIIFAIPSLVLLGYLFHKLN